MTSTKNHEDIESLLTIIAEKNDLSSSVLSFLKKIRSEPPEVLLIGESTHSSIELFKLKFDIALKCIDDDELNFSAILLEADVLPCSSLNRLDTDSDSELDASQVIYSLETECKRFPQWLWKNKETVDFTVQILILSRKRRRDISSKSSSLNTRIIALMGIRIYGLDIYSMNESVDAVEKHIASTGEKDAQELITMSYKGMNKIKRDVHASKELTEAETLASENGVVAVTLLLEARLEILVSENAALAKTISVTQEEIDKKMSRVEKEEDLFLAVLNSHAVKSSERYFSRNGVGHITSWNIRELHFMRTIERVQEHLASRQNLITSIAKDYHRLSGLSIPEKDTQRLNRIVILAHNTHVGDARANSAGKERGDLSLGQLVRERLGVDKSFLLGLTTTSGRIIAANEWGGQSFIRKLSPPLENSYDSIFHHDYRHEFFINFRELKNQIDEKGRIKAALEKLNGPYELRAIGVIYRQDNEVSSHYILTNIIDQFDGIMIVKSSNQITPLESVVVSSTEEI